MPPLNRLVAGILLAAAGHAAFDPAAAQSSDRPRLYEVPGDRVFPEGIALDAALGTIFTGGSADGALYRGDVSSARMETVTDAPSLPQGAFGMRVLSDGSLAVAGGASGALFIHGPNGALVRRINAPPTQRTFLNDLVVVSPSEIYVTDSFRPVLFRADATRDGMLQPWIDFRETELRYQDGFNLNGIVLTEDGRYLIAAQTNAGAFWRIDRTARAVDRIVVEDGPGGADGMQLVGQRLYAVRDGGLSVYDLTTDAATATFRGHVTDTRLRGPTAVALDGTDALLVNAQFSQVNGEPYLPFSITRVPLPEWARP